MIKEWENRFQRLRSQRAGCLKAQEGTTAGGEQDNRKTSKTSSVTHPLIVQDFPYHKEDLCTASPLGIWTAFYRSDPRIALGKYSPMEQEILHLGGVHTIAARRFLADQHKKEWKMLKELQAQSLDYKKATEYRREFSSLCSVCGPPEKIWTAKVVLPAEEFKIPHREMTDINKHIKRMQLARALRSKQFSQYVEKLWGSTLRSGAELGSTATDKFSEEEDYYNRDSSGKVSQKKGEAELKPTKAGEIMMDVIFKSEEPKGCLICHQNDRKTFLPGKRRERRITGQTNRNLFPISGFPGDLMLMNQDFISRGIHPSDAIKMYWLPEEDSCKVHKNRTAHCPY
ncbi:uncharacterized protein C10orf120 homolog [Arvicola amphibius]|uniref:uncharacterized protein C10orf120 homolog n=1 Tax=Arvicola amphibius TaxID=1047088 RepID=UPI0018E38E7F|nr:uncharacterized protein C10orf120 homolog [Arvicola amphibius]